MVESLIMTLVWGGWTLCVFLMGMIVGRYRPDLPLWRAMRQLLSDEGRE